MGEIKTILSELKDVADDLDLVEARVLADTLTRVMRRVAQLRPHKGVQAPLEIEKSNDAAKALKSNTLQTPVYLGKVKFNNRTLPNAVAIHGDSQGYVHTNDPKWGTIHPKKDAERWRQYVAANGWPSGTQPLSCFGHQAGSTGTDYQGEIEIGMSEDQKGNKSFTMKGD